MNKLAYLSGRAAKYAFACSIPLVLPFASAQDDDEVFELSPFSVDVSGDEGWVASSTLTGSRTNQELKNIPLSVDALTPEFMQDLGINNLEDAAFYISGMDAIRQDESRNDQELSSFRGMVTGGRENSQAARNNFMWYSRSDGYNVERIDFNKGSNSLMFGDTSPGGQASVYTKRAQFRDFGEVYVQGGSHDSFRLQLDVNKKISDKFALRFNTVNKNDRSYIDFGEDALKGYDLAATFKLAENTQIRLNAEDLSFERNRTSSAINVEQRAAEGRGLTSSSRQWFTMDGDYYDGRTRLYYPSDGSGGFGTPYTIDSADRRNGSGGDNLPLWEGHTQVTYGRDGEPLITTGPVDPAANIYGARSFQDREVNNYTFILEQGFGDLNLEFGANLQEQFQVRNDSDYSTTMRVAGNGGLYNYSDSDQKWFGNDVNTYRLTGSYPLQIGENISQFIVANVTYLDDEAYSFRQRLVNKAKAWDPDTQTYDTSVDLTHDHRIRTFIEYSPEDPIGDMRNEGAWDALRPENMPNVPGVFEPMWTDYTTANKPYTDKRYAKSASISANGTYFNGKLRSLIGVREDEFALKRYQLPNLQIGNADDRIVANIAEYGEPAFWGQDTYLGSPDDAPEHYAYPPELLQSSTTYNVGLVYAVTDSVNVYANQASSFRWQGTEDFLGRVIGAQEGLTNEIGFKSSFADNKLSLTGAFYEIDRANVAGRVNDDNGRSTIERLFNDQFYDIDEDGNIEYLEPNENQPGYQVTGQGLNQEHRQVLSSETTEGWELNLMMRRTAGLQARIGVSHNKTVSQRDMTEYAEQVALARARVPVRQAYLDEFWASTPEGIEGILPGAEIDLRDALENAEQVLVENADNAGKIIGSRTRPYMATWILDYEFGENFILPNMRMLLQGRWSDNYLMSTSDGMDWIDGSRHPVSLSFLYKTQIMDRQIDFRFKIRDLYDFENGEIKTIGGFRDPYTDELTWKYRNEPPTTYELSARMKF